MRSHSSAPSKSKEYSHLFVSKKLISLHFYIMPYIINKNILHSTVYLSNITICIMVGRADITPALQIQEN